MGHTTGGFTVIIPLIKAIMLSILFIYFNHYHDSKTLGFIYFCRLKNTSEAIGLHVTLLTKDTWLRAKKPPSTPITHP